MRSLGGGIKMEANAPAHYFCYRRFFFLGHLVDEGQIKNGGRVGGEGVMYVKGCFKPV